MNRQSFIRNTLMALCISLVPKNLLPVSGEVIEEGYEAFGFEGIVPAIERSLHNSEYVVYHSPEFMVLFDQAIKQL